MEQPAVIAGNLPPVDCFCPLEKVSGGGDLNPFMELTMERLLDMMKLDGELTAQNKNGF